ncbi:phosphotransferase [Shewanella sedimentimangrovi]|uniref:Phosphotransferase n=1 Tax=Shewanella sedimentimangrovi TaxID=2814293 RepID=A0ABX7QYE7_9GAMM|nr:phosphotransferase [Shewanella sedimentimangrovi]QSX35833.1 phosphotransferase [Shewanella sedimentimangrovi]
MMSVLPANALAFVAAQGLAQATVEPLTLGLSNSNYRLSLGDSHWVLRVNSAACSAFCQREFEAANWRLASDAGLAPKLLAVSADGQCYLAPWLEDGNWHELNTELAWREWHSADTEQEHDLEPERSVRARLLFELLQGLATLPVPANHKGFSQQWQDYQGALAGCSLSCPDADGEWLRAHGQLQARLPTIEAHLARLEHRRLPLQYAHRDLSPLNLLHHEGRLFAIDFEFSCASHPLWDLATVLASHQLSAAERSGLAQDYLAWHPQLQPQDTTLLGDALAMHWHFAAIWALLMAAGSGDKVFLLWFDRYLQLASA